MFQPIHLEDIVPNPTPDDLTLSRAYLLWVNPPEPGEDRRGTLPDRDVEITVPAMWPYPEQLVKLGEELHSFLNPANPGAGPKLVVALGTGDVPVDDVKGLGWHIHPGILNDDQLAKWTTRKDLEDADAISRLFEEGRATIGYLPRKVTKEANDKRKPEDREPDWSVSIRKRLISSRDGTSPLGPAAAWALVGNDIPLQYSQRMAGRVQISPNVPLESEKAAYEQAEERARNIRALYDRGIVPRKHVPSHHPRDRDEMPLWARQTLTRLFNLAKDSSRNAASMEPEIAALRESGGFELEPTKSGKSFKISSQNKQTCAIGYIIANLKRPGAAEPPTSSHGHAQQQNPLGTADFAQQPGVPYGQPPAQPSLQSGPEVPTWAAAGAFAPPSPSGYQRPSFTTPAEPLNRTSGRPQSRSTRGRK
ncbi:hypothetical protein ACQEU8_03920 [Streptomyces sp. CA-250714]|uniref:hypothetical protein n=1 Tax=Streptomyces sp. CA-250714 TaxID=3240060 RepID=UPI003D944356